MFETLLSQIIKGVLWAWVLVLLYVGYTIAGFKGFCVTSVFILQSAYLGYIYGQESREKLVRDINKK